MMFNVDDQAVYPAHGVGVIRGIESREIGGKRQTFYILKVLDTGMTIMVPTDNAGSIGMRAVASPGEVERVFDVLRQREAHNEKQPWNRRHRDYMSKIMTGSLKEVARVLRDLSMLKYTKTLSFGERQMLETARNLFVREVAVALGTTEDAVDNEVHGIFQEAFATRMNAQEPLQVQSAAVV